jgi:hypothetical protein
MTVTDDEETISMETLRRLHHLTKQTAGPGGGARRRLWLQPAGAHPIRGMLVLALVLVSIGTTASVSLGHGGLSGPVDASAQQSASTQVLAVHANSAQFRVIDGSRLPWMYTATRKYGLPWMYAATRKYGLPWMYAATRKYGLPWMYTATRKSARPSS